MSNSYKIVLLIFLLTVIFGLGIFLINKPGQKTSIQSLPKAQISQTPKNISNETVVNVTETGFSPSTLRIKAGTRVIWINKTNKRANVSSDDHPTHLLYPFLNLGEFGKNSSVQLVFDKPGRYTYHNHYISGQKGTIVVE